MMLKGGGEAKKFDGLFHPGLHCCLVPLVVQARKVFLLFRVSHVKFPFCRPVQISQHPPSL
jgi:hypothetical protein